MKKSDITREKLLQAATRAFCAQSYSNVTLRMIAKEAGVDVALVSRYFGGKLGLFEAMLACVFDWPEMAASTDPVAVAIAKYTQPETEDAHMSVIRMIVVNGADPEVGDLLRVRLREMLIDPMLERMGGAEAAPKLAMFIAATLGAAMVRHTLRLPGMTDVSVDEYGAQLRHMLDAALTYEQT
ncbi:TetR/AcrR family transcriptional regulator [Yoonia sp. I 8.24]|uniref:TetR/AcrR family transcriptional regulator n=1 Tax=Yoonia sp. I 8.24 TaxID=1537229 RepID=UPI001EDD0285|nr:TetR/AcrR family transcriptional regulator [Yoonia sp. I 8.24]MCG3267811.1 TetR/AcrR family transcriptional regulator [Yoonia sp. I 8.24]